MSFCFVVQILHADAMQIMVGFILLCIRAISLLWATPSESLQVVQFYHDRSGIMLLNPDSNRLQCDDLTWSSSIKIFSLSYLV